MSSRNTPAKTFLGVRHTITYNSYKSYILNFSYLHLIRYLNTDLHLIKDLTKEAIIFMLRSSVFSFFMFFFLRKSDPTRVGHSEIANKNLRTRGGGGGGGEKQNLATT